MVIHTKLHQLLSNTVLTVIINIQNKLFADYVTFIKIYHQEIIYFLKFWE